MNVSLKQVLLSMSVFSGLLIGPLAAQQAAGPKPTEANVPYGKHPKQVVDFYKAEVRDADAAVLVNIHGGGWRGGSKDRVAPRRVPQRRHLGRVGRVPLHPRGDGATASSRR